MTKQWLRKNPRPWTERYQPVLAGMILCVVVVWVYQIIKHWTQITNFWRHCVN